MLHRGSQSYIIVQPEFTAPVGMRNRLCHELHLCHCNPQCDISHPVNEDHMALTGCQLKSNSSHLHVLFALRPGRISNPSCCFIAYICRSEAILLNLGYTLHSYCVSCQGKMGQEGMCYVGSFRKRIQFCQAKWHRLPQDRLTGLHAAHYRLPGCHEFRSYFSQQIKQPLICGDLRG